MQNMWMSQISKEKKNELENEAVDEIKIFSKVKPSLLFETVDELIILGKDKPELELEEVDSIEIIEKSKPENISEKVDELNVVGHREPLLIETVDELLIASEFDIKLAKSTWDLLDVQGSGFELLGKSTVSRLENQDVDLAQVNIWLNQRKCNLEVDYIDDLIIDSLEKPQLEIDYLDNFAIKISDKDEEKTEKIIINKGVTKEEIIDKTSKARNVIAGQIIKSRTRDEQEIGSISSISNISKNAIVDITHRDKKKNVKRDEAESETGSELLNISRKGKEVIVRGKRTYSNSSRKKINQKRDEFETESLTESQYSKNNIKISSSSKKEMSKI